MSLLNFEEGGADLCLLKTQLGEPSNSKSRTVGANNFVKVKVNT